MTGNFAADLYSGTADFYDRFRLPYPTVLIEDLLRRVQPSGRGRLLDLACGTGQLAVALQDRFAEVWAVDQEPDMIRRVQAKAVKGLHAITSGAETLSVDAAGFELVTIGNAFHRLTRELVAGHAFEWLRPGGQLALCWSSSPWTGDSGWSVALNEVLDEWRAELGAEGRVPPDWERPIRRKPHVEVLTDAGFVAVGRFEFPVDHCWTVGELAGLVYSTSVLPAPLFGARAAEFERDLAERLTPHGPLVESVTFAYDLVRKPS